jgi:hypothetical protein
MISRRFTSIALSVAVLVMPAFSSASAAQPDGPVRVVGESKPFKQIRFGKRSNSGTFAVGSAVRVTVTDTDSRTTIEKLVKRNGAWTPEWSYDLIADKDPWADAHPGYSGPLPRVLTISGDVQLVGFYVSRSTGYSGGGANAEYLTLLRLDNGEPVMTDLLVGASKLIRACFSEADYNSGGPCHDDYFGNSTITLAPRKGVALRRAFTVAMSPQVRRPSDPSSDTPQVDRVAVCSSVSTDFVWNAGTGLLDATRTEPDVCPL